MLLFFLFEESLRLQSTIYSECLTHSMYLLVNVKWGKQTFKDLELDTGSDVESFKVVLMSLSNVLPENQKLMIKGKIVKDGDDLTKFPLKDGLTLMMMGTAEE